jgi:hypothetical protein
VRCNRLLAVAVVAALAAGCPAELAVGEACGDSSDCASGVCIAAGKCLAGTAYGAFCSGERCVSGACPDAQQQCIRIAGAEGEIEVCVPASICPRAP